MRGPWNNGPQWEVVEGEEAYRNADSSGDGSATVKLTQEEVALGQQAAERSKSNLDSDPTTGADLAPSEGAGATTGEKAGESGGGIAQRSSGGQSRGRGASSERSTHR